VEAVREEEAKRALFIVISTSRRGFLPTDISLLPTPTVVAKVRFSAAFVCLSVCLFIRTISQKPMQLRSPNSTQKYSTMSLGNPFIFGSKGQRSRSRAQKLCRRGCGACWPHCIQTANWRKADLLTW